MVLRGPRVVQQLPGTATGTTTESRPGTIGHIILDTKQAGERSAANPHAAFDAAGTGDVTMVDGMRSIAKAVEVPPEPNVYAPVLDPTGRRTEASAKARLLRPDFARSVTRFESRAGSQRSQVPYVHA